MASPADFGYGLGASGGVSAATLLAGSSNTQVLFNDSGAIAGDSGLVFNKTTNDLGVGGAITITGSGRVVGVAAAAPTFSSGSVTSNVATITCTAAHNLVSGQIVTISASAGRVVDGVALITVTSSTAFTFPFTVANGTITAATITPNAVLQLGTAPLFSPAVASGVIAGSQLAIANNMDDPLDYAILKNAGSSSRTLNLYQGDGTSAGTMHLGIFKFSGYMQDDTATIAIQSSAWDTPAVRLANDAQVGWTSATSAGAGDTGLARSAAGIVKFTNGTSGNGGFLSQLGSSIVGHADEVQLTIKGHSAQTSHIQDWILSTNAVVGNFMLNSGVGRLTTGEIVAGDPTDVSLSSFCAQNGNVVCLGANLGLVWSANNTFNPNSFGADAGLARSAAGVIKSTNAAGGAGWIQNTSGELVKAADQTVDSTTLANDTHLLTASIATTRKIGFELVIFFTAGDTVADGWKLDFNQGTATMTDFIADGLCFDGGVATAITNYRSTAIGTVMSQAATTNQNFSVVVRGHATINGAGTFGVKWAKNADVGTALTARKGSRLKLWDMP